MVLRFIPSPILSRHLLYRNARNEAPRRRGELGFYKAGLRGMKPVSTNVRLKSNKVFVNAIFNLNYYPLFDVHPLEVPLTYHPNNDNFYSYCGGMAEWLMAAVLKTVVPC